ncbi:MAG: helix-turn-helix domain-containing protein [Egibacteraceae bacterium]
MIVVATWTGLQARVLRHALRMTVLGFAEHLGVGARTVSDWEAGGVKISPKPGMQEMLDVALERASDEVKVRFATLVSATAEVVSYSSTGRGERRRHGPARGRGAHPRDGSRSRAAIARHAARRGARRA